MAFSREQLRNAATIAQVGNQLGASARDIQIAIMTALVESNLINVNYGDRDSLGLFQQRAAWGPRSVRLDPAKSARMFFLGGRQGQQGLFQVSNRNSRPMGEVAQDVQVSAYPDRYAMEQDEAARILGRIGEDGGEKKFGDLSTLGGVSPDYESTFSNPFGDTSQVTQDFATPGEGLLPTALEELTGSGNEQLVAGYNPAVAAAETPISEASQFGQSGWMQDITIPSLESFGITAPDVGVPGPATAGGGGADLASVEGWRRKVVKFAESMLGVPYVWGGTTQNGVDCSGLVVLAMKRAGISMPRVSADQARSGKRIGLKGLKPGDLVAWDNSSRNNGADHIAIYIGNGRVIHAPSPGQSVEISKIWDRGQAWGVRMGN